MLAFVRSSCRPAAARAATIGAAVLQRSLLRGAVFVTSSTIVLTFSAVAELAGDPPVPEVQIVPVVTQDLAGAAAEVPRTPSRVPALQDSEQIAAATTPAAAMAATTPGEMKFILHPLHSF